MIGGIHGVNRLGGSRYDSTCSRLCHTHPIFTSSLLDCVVYGRISGRSASKSLLSGFLSGQGTTSGQQNQDVTIHWADNTLTVTRGKQTAAGSELCSGYCSRTLASLDAQFCYFDIPITWLMLRKVPLRLLKSNPRPLHSQSLLPRKRCGTQHT